MIHSISHHTVFKNPLLRMKNCKKEVLKTKNQITDILEKSFSFKLNTVAHACMKKEKARKIESKEVPAGVAIGLVEIFAGALACILPFPGARVAEGILIGDGVRRVADEGEKLDQKNRGDKIWPNELPRPIDRTTVPN